MKHGESIAGFTTSCTYCGDEIIKDVKQHAEGLSFCDKSCEAEWRSKQTGSDSFRWEGGVDERECPACGDKHTPPQDKRYRKTCSNECYRKLQSQKTKGENNPNWKGGYGEYYGTDWEDMRDKIRLKDDNTCQMCGFTTDERFIPVHHILPVRDFDEPNDANYEANLAQVCRACHPKVESMTVAEQVDALGIERVQEVMDDV